MTLSKPYKYLYYKLYMYAERTEKKLGQAGMPEWIALFSVSILLFINAGIAIFLVKRLFGIQVNLSKFSMFITAAIVYLINYLFFIREKKYLQIIKQFERETRTQATIRTILVWFYIILSFVLFYVVLPLFNDIIL